MNGLLILVGIILLVCVIAGLVRGFIKIVASLAATIIIIVLVVFLTPYVSKGILKVTPFREDGTGKMCGIINSGFGRYGFVGD